MTDPSSNLEEAQRLVAITLASARTELVELDRRRVELIALIARTETMHDALTSDGRPARAMTLHEAVAYVLEDNANRWMTTRELVDAINARHLYRKRDGRPVEINQIHARVNNYNQLFEKDGTRVRLREIEPSSS